MVALDEVSNKIMYSRPIASVIEAVVTDNRGYKRIEGCGIFPEGDAMNVKMTLGDYEELGFMYPNWGREFGHPGFDVMDVYVLKLVRG